MNTPLQLEQPVGSEQEVPLHQHRLPPPQQVQLQDLQDVQGQRKEVRHPVRIGQPLRVPLRGRGRRGGRQRQRAGFRRGHVRARDGICGGKV